MFFNDYDSEHEIITDIYLADGAELHRFITGGGKEYSAIYLGGTEMTSCERRYEAGMIENWNENTIKW